MKKFESKIQLVEQSAQTLFSFLADFNNFQRLLPEQVENWQSTQSTCSFAIKGLTSLSMEMGEHKLNEHVVMNSAGKVPFQFVLNTFIETVGEHQCSVKLVFDADLNPMLAMMASRPLQNFVEMLADKLNAEMSNF